MDREELLFYYQKYRNGTLALSQIAERLNVSVEELREKFNSMAGVNESRQTLNG